MCQELYYVYACNHHVHALSHVCEFVKYQSSGWCITLFLRRPAPCRLEKSYRNVRKCCRACRKLQVKDRIQRRGALRELDRQAADRARSVRRDKARRALEDGYGAGDANAGVVSKPQRSRSRRDVYQPTRRGPGDVEPMSTHPEEFEPMSAYLNDTGGYYGVMSSHNRPYASETMMCENMIYSRAVSPLHGSDFDAERVDIPRHDEYSHIPL